MSEGFSIQSKAHEYAVHFVEHAGQTLASEIREGDEVVLDANVYRLHQDRLAGGLEGIDPILIDPSEEKKSYGGVGPIIELLIERGFRKNHRLIAIGGGITQDIVTFIAANIFRGVDWVFLPTTLLAQGDSCIGGKASINFGKYKNLLGNFYPPNEIYVDLEFLETLPDKEIVSGLGEMTHFFFVSGQSAYELIRDKGQQALEDRRVLEELIRNSLEIKKATIEVDEFDQGVRQLFNYGHSFGHAIETITNYRVPHGIAVSHGMDIANYISAKMGLIEMTLREQLREVLERYWDQVPLGDLDVDAFIDALRKDKKNVGNDVKVILTRGLGDMCKATLEVDGEARDWIESYVQNEAWRGPT